MKENTKRPFLLKSEVKQHILTPKTPMKSTTTRNIIVEHTPFKNGHTSASFFDSESSSTIPEQENMILDKNTQEYIYNEKIGEGDYCEVYKVQKEYKDDIVKSNVNNQSLKRRSCSLPFNRIKKIRIEPSINYTCIKKNKTTFLGIKNKQKRMREVKIMNKLRGCSNVLQILKAWEENNTLLIETEYCDFGTLKDLIQAIYAIEGKKFTKKLINKIMYEVSNGLSEIHKNEILHCDIKPDNIFIKQTGSDFYEKKDLNNLPLNSYQFIIGDFNISIFTTDKIDEDGDKKYMPPETLLNKVYKTSDVYSLGLIYLELLTGIDLPSGGEYWDRLRKNSFRWLKLSRIEKSAREILLRMIDVDYNKRVSSCELAEIFKNRIK